MRILPTLLALFLTPLALTGSVVRPAGSMQRWDLCASRLNELSKKLPRHGQFEAQDLDWEKGALLLHGAKVAFAETGHTLSPLKGATEAWNAALGSTILEPIENPSKANVKIRLVDQIPDGAEVQGELLTNDGIGTQGAIQAELLIRNNVDGRKLTEREIQAVITHELGHLLGLDDSVTGMGIMGEFDPSNVVTAPTSDEVNAVKLIRRQILLAFK